MSDMSFELFKLSSKGYCCTQIMLKLALEAEEKENEDLIRASKGLCLGIGGTQKTCGVLTGGIGILGLYAAKGNDKESTKEDYSSMVEEFINWFEEEFESTECIDIIGPYDFENKEKNSNTQKCGDIIAKSYSKVVEILLDHGYEYGSREA